MVQAKSCDGCSQAHDCRKIYEQLGQAGGPSVALKVTIAFALPIISFMAGLATFGRLLRGRLAEPYQTPVAFVLALAVTVGLTCLASVAVRRQARKPQHPE